ncbi:MAG: FAD-dependent oxidoreductase [Planctomycetes bacterium]|nr:FAD-dependent oxidoreductase [Planctomycetota bacterium]
MDRGSREGRAAERDVVVVGGGVLGVFTAWRLAKAGRSVTLLEESTRVGGDRRRTEIGGFEVDLGVALQPNTCPRVSRAWIEAMGGRHRYVPIVHGDRVGHRSDLSRDELGRLMPLGDRLQRVFESVRRVDWSVVTLADALRTEFGPTAWERVHRNYYESLFGRPCDGLDAANRRALGLDVPARGDRSGLRGALLDLLRGSSPGELPVLGPASSWPGPNHDPEDVEPTAGLYPSQGCFAAFVDALVGALEATDAEVELSAACDAVDIDGGRVRSVRAGGRSFAAEDFVFVGSPGVVFEAVEVSIEPPELRALAQVDLVVSHPVPDRLWDVHHDAGVIVRTAYPQRFQAIEPGERNVVTCETYHDAAVIDAIERDPTSLVTRVVSELVSSGTIPTTAFVDDSRLTIARDALPGFRVGYFERLAAGVANVRERLPNVWFAGVPATLAPTEPPTDAFASVLDLAERLGRSELVEPSEDASLRSVKTEAVGSPV